MSTRIVHFLAEIARYAMASAISLVIDVGILTVLTELFGFHYLVSAPIAYCVGLVVNYAISVLYVFRTRRVSNRRIEFVGFVGIGLLGLGINQILMWLFTSILGVFYPVSRAISAFVGYTWKYLARKVLLFSSSRAG